MPIAYSCAWPKRTTGFSLVGGGICRAVVAIASALTMACLSATETNRTAGKLLTPETLLVVSAPDFAKVRTLWTQSPYGRLWADSALRPYREKFEEGWEEDVVRPLERLMHMRWEDWKDLPQGQLTFALVSNPQEESVEWVLLVEAAEKSKLKPLIGELRGKWFDLGKQVRVETVKGYEVTVLTLTTNDLPEALRSFWPKSLPVQELGRKSTEPRKRSMEVYLCPAGSLLVVTRSMRGIEQVLARMGETSAPSLEEQGAFSQSQTALLRDSPAYAWINTVLLSQLLNRSAQPENPDAPNPFQLIKLDKLVAATGLGNVRSAALATDLKPEGLTVTLNLSVPEAGRSGLFKLLAVQGKDARPPAFVPADVARFRRFRIDSQQAWTTLHQIMSELSPQWMSSINFLLDTADMAARSKDPDFNVRKSVIANFGDDWIRYEKASAATNEAGLEETPSLVLIGSPNPDQLAGALKNIMIFLSPQAADPTQRDFLGRRIYSVPMPPLPFPFGSGLPSEEGATLSYGANGGYVGLTSEAALLEEFLRSSEGWKPLAELPGLTEAAQVVLRPGSGLFGYQNQQELMRVRWNIMRSAAPVDTNTLPAPITGKDLLGLPSAEKPWSKWQEPNLLPPFEQVSRYFHFSVTAGTATTDGLTWRMHWPTPPALRNKTTSEP